MKIFSYLVPQIIAKYKSKINGEIKVVRSFGKIYIEAGNLMQSGEFLERIFAKGFKKLKIFDKHQVQKIAVLGLGAGSVVRVLQKNFPKADLCAVEKDEMMVSIANKYFNLNQNHKLRIKIMDAFDWLKQDKNHYDLIFVDLYIGKIIPQKFESILFIKQIFRLLNNYGYMIYNRLYFQKHKNEADIFIDKLNKIFQNVKKQKIYSNLLVKITKV